MIVTLDLWVYYRAHHRYTPGERAMQEAAALTGAKFCGAGTALASGTRDMSFMVMKSNAKAVREAILEAAKKHSIKVKIEINETVKTRVR